MAVVHRAEVLQSRYQFDWSVGDTLYTGNFFFDEVEVVRKFKEAFGTDHKRKGEFVVRVSKYNNWFDISLYVEGRE